MLPEWMMALLVLLRERWSTRRDAHVHFLKLQVDILRSRLPGDRVIPDPVERRRLLKVGAEVGHAVKDTLGILSIKTYRRWLREQRGGRKPGKSTAPPRRVCRDVPLAPVAVTALMISGGPVSATPMADGPDAHSLVASELPASPVAAGGSYPARHIGPPPAAFVDRVTYDKRFPYM